VKACTVFKTELLECLTVFDARAVDVKAKMFWVTKLTFFSVSIGEIADCGAFEACLREEKEEKIQQMAGNERTSSVSG
jgi:hypothetical protein